MSFQHRAALTAFVCLAATAAAHAQPFRPGATPSPPPAVPAPAAAGYLGLTADTAVTGGGVEVLTVEPGGPAARASFRVGDVIQRIDRVAVTTVEELGAEMVKRRAGEALRIEVRRGLNLLELPVKLEARPADPGRPPAAPRAARGAAVASGMLGVVATPVDAVTAARLGLTVPRGALVDRVVPNTPAQAARIPLGAVIVAIDEVQIDTPDDLQSAIATSGPGATITVQYYEGTALRGVRLTLASKEAAGAIGADARAVLRQELQQIKEQLAAMQARVDELERALAAAGK